MKNFPKVHHLKIVIQEKFLRLSVTARFQKKENFKKVNFLILFFQSISYNNVIATKQIYFSPTFLKNGFTSLIILQV